ncbi:MAG: hypothetical protein BGO82_15805 [Devosia sp. 67-54]|uniref:DUF2336 domain-containing protein n=1 Tax=unclassified Devosia TaxID=196773 RepID=UPI00095C1E56|nr:MULTISPECIES: DUF2336 domain-containing protein [unclassified Devosia]MBN9303839.1 DUF2336 domain-containing protein [Devosia sp.]OJX17697.1 MAG: hypothetical protein BGO82_15805 [Devosia sp. 67-54]
MFYNNGRDHIAESEVRLFADVVGRALEDMSEEHREEFSDRVASDPRTPRDLALRLAGDTAVVAAPVLGRSPVLTDDDLISIASSKGTGHRLAISRREHVSARVTDVLIDFEETEVMLSLLDNQTARTSPAGMKKLAGHAENIAELREKLCRRDDVPQSILQRIMPLLSEEARERAELLLESGNEQLSGVMAQAGTSLAVERAERARRRLAIKAMAQRVASGALGLDAFVADLASQNRPLDLALGLSSVAALPERQVANAVISLSAEPLALVCKALDMTPASYRIAEGMRRESMRLSREVPAASLEQYGRLDVATARRGVRFVQVRANVAAG